MTDAGRTPRRLRGRVSVRPPRHGTFLLPEPSPSTAPNSSTPRRVVVLGSTGSIGVSTLDVIDQLGDRLQAVGLAAHRSWPKLVEQAQQFRPRFVTITEPAARRGAS